MLAAAGPAAAQSASTPSSTAAEPAPTASPPPVAPPAPAPPEPAPLAAPAPPAPPVISQAPPPPADERLAILPVDIHAFASQGFILTTGNDYIVADTKHGSFQFSEVGLNVTKEITDRLRLGVQAFAQNLGLGGNFNLKADWYYVDYRWTDWFGFRAGRLKIPFGIYNEINDVDSARVPILLPQSVYPLQGRNFLFAQTGAEVYGFLRSSSAGALDYRLYFGTIFIDLAILTPTGSPVQLQLNVRYVGGGRLFWETPLPGLRVGASVLAVHLDTTAFVSGMMFSIANQSLLAMGSAEYAVNGMVATVEYSRWHAHQDSVLPSSNFSRTSERSYAMLSYRVSSWFQTALYYALFFPDVSQRKGSDASRQDDASLTLRFDANAHWIVKAEGHYMVGTAGLGAPLSISTIPPNEERHWTVFLLKTTGYF
ncbi:MAG TPA: hypothetical protein VNO55_31530 [Polyangia bacterium]|nr:hypothetical protein [Polyangia bacterium]